MSYVHMFYAVDLDRLVGCFGGGDETLKAEVVGARSEDLEDNDAFFEDAIEEEGCPDSATVLGEIIAGSISTADEPAMYGYVLKILVEHLGQPIGDDVYAVRDHPYKSQLVQSGPPVPIPYTRDDFPEIGFLSGADIPGEIARLDAAPKKARKSLVLSLLSKLSGGIIGKQMNDSEVAEDMEAYRETLQETLDKGLAVVSFRH